MAKGPLRRVVKAELWSGHGPIDTWKTQGYWYELELECGHHTASKRIHPAPNWQPAGTKPQKRARCAKCAVPSENCSRD